MSDHLFCYTAIQLHQTYCFWLPDAAGMGWLHISFCMVLAHVKHTKHNFMRIFEAQVAPAHPAGLRAWAREGGTSATTFASSMAAAGMECVTLDGWNQWMATWLCCLNVEVVGVCVLLACLYLSYVYFVYLLDPACIQHFRRRNGRLILVSPFLCDPGSAQRTSVAWLRSPRDQSNESAIELRGSRPHATRGLGMEHGTNGGWWWL